MGSAQDKDIEMRYRYVFWPRFCQVDLDPNKEYFGVSHLIKTQTFHLYLFHSCSSFYLIQSSFASSVTSLLSPLDNVLTDCQMSSFHYLNYIWVVLEERHF